MVKIKVRVPQEVKRRNYSERTDVMTRLIASFDFAASKSQRSLSALCFMSGPMGGGGPVIPAVQDTFLFRD
jgi:hypothetical protein